MPLVRLDEEEVKVDSQKENNLPSTKKKVEKGKKSKGTNKNLYPVLYVILAIAVFGLGLLVIALINLAIGNGFTI